MPTPAAAPPSRVSRQAIPAGSSTWDAALAVLAGNVKTVPRYDHPVLVEGSVYPGIWQECGPHEGLVYGTLAHYITTQEGAPTPAADRPQQPHGLLRAAAARRS